ncbi:hypothetical protein [Parasitella parasitica]|uniref:Uncharacterized protein n=1 Tax=Parasitella parasitica TaxID=35722 RepID=A0A0B7N3B7_9FUNG|nr:hypothetical protein [Parasitella parasitica]
MSDRRFRHTVYTRQAQTRSFFDPIESSPLDGKMRIDSQTGFTYRKPILLQRPNFDFTPTSSQITPLSPTTPPPAVSSTLYQSKYLFNDNSSLGSSEILPLYDIQPIPPSTRPTLVALRPPSHVPVFNYYRYTTPGLSPLQRSTQIMIWIAEKELMDEDAAAINRGQSFDKTKRILREAKLKMIRDLRDNIIFNRSDNVETKNPIDSANAEKLVELGQYIKTFQDELHDWKDFSGGVYQRHAEAKDTIQGDTSIDYDDIDIDWMLENLDETQREFYYEYCSSMDYNEDEDYSEKFKEIIDPGVTQMRQALNTANQFVLETDNYVKGRLASLAKKVRDNSRIIPTEYDHRIPGVFDDSEKRRKESELRNIQLMLRLSTLQHSKPATSENS